MRNFFKYVLATVTGILIASILMVLIFIGIIAAIVSSATSEKTAVVSDNSILHVQLAHSITERTIPNPFENLDIPGMPSTKSLGLDDILARIEGAADDDRIKGILLDLSDVPASFATLQEIRDALLDFKTSEKFVVAYGETYSQRAYYLASVADQLYINPEGMLDFRGLASQTPFFKETLDKIGVEVQVVKVGTYKSAVEPFIQQQMSEENREQVAAYLSHIYQHFLSEIGESRGMSTDSLYNIADQMLVRNANDAVQLGLADQTIYKDELIADLKGRLDIDEEDDINAASLFSYSPSKKASGSSRDRIAILYAVGEIRGGEGEDQQIGSERISRELRKLRRDERVKALVFRINSPGGSALASDVIWREVDLLRKKKPVIVSMGDVAASGGYYIAAAADSIFAQPNTLTGSIGVFGLIPNMQALWNDKLGVHFDGVKTGRYADFMSGTFDRPMTDDERQMLQIEIDRIYNTFIGRVAVGRDMTTAYVDSIGQGRVWSGTQALKIGLVDKLGDLEDAVQAAAYAADLDSYRLVRYPSIKGPFDSLLGGSAERIKTWIFEKETGVPYHLVKQVKNALQMKGAQARLPFDLIVY